MKLGKPTHNNVDVVIGQIWLKLFNDRRPMFDIDFNTYGEPLLNNTEKIEEI